jgi:uncharacterized membrane protein YedE/YeeE
MTEFFPQGCAPYLIGGLLIGLAMSLLYLLTGLMGGMSTVFTSSWSYLSRAPYFSEPRFWSSRVWRLVYALGLVFGGMIFVGLGGERFVTEISPWRLLLGGVLMGFGARLSNGCTAGHGICGLASLRLSSLLAVMIFLATAIAVAHLIQSMGVR